VYRLTKGSLAQRSVVLLLALLVIGLGSYAATVLKQELIPSIDIPRGNVITVYAGASPDVVEAQVTKPVETALKGVAGVTSVTSKTSSGVSQVTVQWDYGLNLDDMTNKLRSAVDSISSTLPSGLDPKVVTGSFDDVPVVALAVSSSDSLQDLSTKVTDLVVPDLKTIDGVRDVSVAGQETHEVIITYNQAKLLDKGIDPATIGQVFAANAVAIPSGTMHTDTANLDVQTGTTYSTVDQIADLKISTTDGPVRLGDVAKVVEQPTQSTSISRVNGKTSLTLAVTKEADANTVSVAQAVSARLPALQQELGGSTTFSTIFDQSPYITDSIHDLSVEGGIGLAMAVLVIMIFLGSIRPTIITAISIPLSLLIALSALWIGGYTLNIITLAALTVAIGRVVDDAIVVIENIKRHQGYGEGGAASIANAVKEVAGAVTSSTLTTVAVFLPIGLVGGQSGQIFRPFAVAVTVSLLASLLVAMTVIPVLASVFMRPSAKKPVTTEAEEEHTNNRLQRVYLPVLNWALHRRWITLALAFGLFVVTLASASLLKTDFIGSMGTESLAISQKLPAGASLAETDAAAKKIEQVLASDPSVQTYQTTIGGSSSLFLGGQSDTNQASYTVPLKPNADGKETAARLRTAIGALGSGVGTVEVAVGSSGSSSGVVLYVESSDATLLKTSSDKVTEMLKGIDGLTNVTSDLGDDKDMLQVTVDSKAAAKNGFTQATIGQAVARAVRGSLIGTLAKGDTTLNVYLRSQTPVKNIDELKKIELPPTALMNANVEQDAADAVSKQSDSLQQESKDASTKAYKDQVAALKKSRATAVKAQKTLTSQINATKKKLASLQAQLAQIPAKCQQNPSDPDCAPVASGIYTLSSQLASVGSQLAQLSSALASTKAGVTSIDKQLDALDTSRAKSLEATAKQQKIADASKAAQKATADPIPLTDVADVAVVKAPVMITRVDGMRAATISASNETSDLTTTTNTIKAGIAALNLPSGVDVRIGGVSQQQTESFSQLGLAMLVAIAVVYLIMVATFGSLLQPLILLVSIPFAATGAIGLSLATDTALGVPSMIGLLMLIGIVVTNAIVLIDLINQKRKSGLGVAESIAAGARLRVRPIVMTALATVFALLPMAFGLTGGGVFVSKPLAIVVIGGLVSSTLLTLILVPVLYDLLETWRDKRRSARASRTTAADQAEAEPA
jgi:HAE1 family hydrophobic/amphiphilic exporter-1